jgi:hypothetical protein
MDLPAPRRVGPVLAIVLIGALAPACLKTVERTLVPSGQGATLDARSPYLKAHLRSGSVYVLSDWHVDSAAAVVTGHGALLNPNRDLVTQGEVRLPFDSVALFESNVLKPSSAITALTVMAGVTAVVAGICALNPKSCFGSCPTFYAPDSTGETLQAEGFSGSIAHALEKADVDMLYRAVPHGRDFTLRLTNEALETHVLRYADLLVAARPPGSRVLVTPDGVFRTTRGATPPSRCRAGEGDCRAALLAFDGRERTSLADSSDLAARETIDLEFDRPPAGTLGVVVASRQSLMTTFLIYQALAYMGSETGRWLAALENVPPGRELPAERLSGLLGRIDVLIPDTADGWTTVGSAGEVGPLAVDTKVVPLPRSGGGPVPQRVRLSLTRGLWRLEYVALVALGDTVHPVRITPRAVRRDGRPDHGAQRALTRRDHPLVTFPGDVYQLDYRLPTSYRDADLFLEARGYYLEWMRREWIAEEDQLEAMRMLVLDPAGTLRTLAPAYVRQEAAMERVFWNSRYVRH